MGPEIESTFMRSFIDGEMVETKRGDLVSFVDPGYFRIPRDRRIQREMVESTQKEIGVGPYEIIKIKYSPRQGHPITILEVKGESGSREINKDYFGYFGKSK